jgi:hypothetical protein
MNEFYDAQLEAYLDEGLTLEQTAQIEASLRAGNAHAEQLGERLKSLVGQRDAGVHSLGAVWRQHRLSCPTRQQLGSFLLGILEPSHAEYVEFHIGVIGCRPCEASLSDLREQQAATQGSEIASRRQKYFQSSAGYLEEL